MRGGGVGDLAEGIARPLAEQSGDRRLSEVGFDQGGRLVQATVERAEPPPVGREPQGAADDPLERVDRIDDVQDGQRVQAAGEHVSPAEPSPGADQSRPGSPWSTLERYPAGTRVSSAICRVVIGPIATPPQGDDRPARHTPTSVKSSPQAP